jgi:hypothetical protein
VKRLRRSLRVTTADAPRKKYYAERAAPPNPLGRLRLV